METKFSICAVLLCFTFLMPQSFAQELNGFDILISPSKEDLKTMSDGMGLLRNESGFSKMPETGIWSTGGVVQAAPYDDSGTAKLNAGEYIVVCFRATDEMRVRVINVDINGRSSQMLPKRAHLSAKIDGEVTYCVGDTNSARTFKTPATPGDGTIYVIGAMTGEPPSPIQLPALKDGDEPTGVTELLYRYRISE